MLVQEGEEGGPCLPSGVALVNELSYGQRLGLLRVAAGALLCRDVSAPRRSAYLDAVVASVYDNLRGGVQAELLGEESDQLRQEREARGEPEEPDLWGSDDSLDHLPSTRERIVRACEQDGSLPVPAPECVTYDVWEERIEDLLDRVLLDRDFEYGAVFLDAAPDESGRVKELMGVSWDYHTQLPDELSQEQTEKTITRLGELSRDGWERGSREEERMEKGEGGRVKTFPRGPSTRLRFQPLADRTAESAAEVPVIGFGRRASLARDVVSDLEGHRGAAVAGPEVAGGGFRRAAVVPTRIAARAAQIQLEGVRRLLVKYATEAASGGHLLRGRFAFVEDDAEGRVARKWTMEVEVECGRFRDPAEVVLEGGDRMVDGSVRPVHPRVAGRAELAEGSGLDVVHVHHGAYAERSAPQQIPRLRLQRLGDQALQHERWR